MAALAPLLVCVRRVVGDARRRTGITAVELALIVPIGAAWTTLLAVLDFDLSTRDENINLIQAGAGHGAGLIQETERYERLWQWGASPLRREFVALLVISSVVALVAWRTKRDLVERLPSASIAIGLLIFAATPSKWIWHFGAFTGLAVVAIGLESDRFARGRTSTRARWAAAGVLTAVSLVVASHVEPWGPVDGSRLNWEAVPYLELTGAAVLVALLFARLRSRRGIRCPEALVVIAVAVALIGATTAALATDTATSDGWTAARQVMSSLTGRDTCGLMDEFEIADAPSLRQLEPWPGQAAAGASQRTIASTRRDRWYRAGREKVGVYIRGNWKNQRLIVSWGRSDGNRVHAVVSGAAVLDRAQIGAIPASWWFVDELSFPARPADVDVVRISGARANRTSTAKVSEPFSYETAGLRELLERRDVTTLSSPYLFEALPCATLPRLELGVAQPPNLLLDRGPPPLTNVSSPFIGLTDMYTVWKAPLESQVSRGSYYVWGTVTTYWVVPDPRDAIARAIRRRPE